MNNLSGLQQIQRAAFFLITGTLAANAVSFLKSIIITSYYGTSAELDAYFLSLTPFRTLLGVGMGAFQVVIIPKYLEIREKRGESQSVALLMTCSLWMLGATLGIILLLIGASAPFSRALAPGFSPELLGATSHFLQLSTILLGLSVINEMGKAYLQAHRRFFGVSLLPFLSAVGSCAYVVVFRYYGITSLMHSLIFGVVIELSGLVLFFLPTFFPAQLTILPMLDVEIRRTGMMLLPLLLSSSFVYINVAVDQAMASTLTQGSISALNYAIKLHSLVTQIFVMIVSKATLPFLAQHVAEGNFIELKATFVSVAKKMLAVLVPVTICIVLFSHPLVKLAFERGAFTEESRIETANAWIAYSLGLPIYAVAILTTRLYNALQDNMTLMWVSAVGILLNVVMNWCFMQYMGTAGIALSTSVSYFVSSAILLVRLHRKFPNDSA